jgi:hypothetical protein
MLGPSLENPLKCDEITMFGCLLERLILLCIDSIEYLIALTRFFRLIEKFI